MKTLDLTTTANATTIAAAVKTLQSGGLVIFPTETVYGAGVDATHQAAVDKLLSYKSRREGKPLSIAVPDEKMAAKYVKLNEQAQKLYARFLPGPVTVVSRGRGQVAAGVESEFGTLGVRIPNQPLLLKILRAFGKPITATSANASGKKRPYQINDILYHLSGKQKNLIDLILDAGQLPPNEPSAVIDTTLSTPTVLRAGQIKAETGSESLISHSEAETKKIASVLLLKNWEQLKEKGLVIGLDGVLGAGKTVFTKGVAAFLQIPDEITSPTYSYIEEYDYERHGVKGKLYHLDLWKVETKEELKRLEINQLIAPQNVIVIEWWGQYQSHLTQLSQQKQIQPLSLKITEQAKGSRKIIF